MSTVDMNSGEQRDDGQASGAVQIEAPAQATGSLALPIVLSDSEDDDVAYAPPSPEASPRKARTGSSNGPSPFTIAALRGTKRRRRAKNTSDVIVISDDDDASDREGEEHNVSSMMPTPPSTPKKPKVGPREGGESSSRAVHNALSSPERVLRAHGVMGWSDIPSEQTEGCLLLEMLPLEILNMITGWYSGLLICDYVALSGVNRQFRNMFTPEVWTALKERMYEDAHALTDEMCDSFLFQGPCQEIDRLWSHPLAKDNVTGFLEDRTLTSDHNKVLGTLSPLNRNTSIVKSEVKEWFKVNEGHLTKLKLRAIREPNRDPEWVQMYILQIVAVRRIALREHGGVAGHRSHLRKCLALRRKEHERAEPSFKFRRIDYAYLTFLNTTPPSTQKRTYPIITSDSEDDNMGQDVEDDQETDGVDATEEHGAEEEGGAHRDQIGEEIPEAVMEDVIGASDGLNV